MGFTWKLFRYPPQKVRGNWARGPRLQPGRGRLAGAVDGDEELLFAFFDLDLG